MMAEHPDTFSAAIALIGLAVDPKACAARLTYLQKQLDAVAKAQAKLDADREQHAAAVAAAKAALDARCPHPAEADIRAQNACAAFDPFQTSATWHRAL
jgi:hypothetical protein